MAIAQKRPITKIAAIARGIIVMADSISRPKAVSTDACTSATNRRQGERRR
ncbi:MULTISPECIES: hypothetical protein [Fischerella]|uniref:hypothetical protein n=1 Tax=Fischerella TaxID=1190 RepID=UPI0015B9BF2A|nr:MULTISPECIES: hypothetical protein [Fischerella]